MAATKVVIGYSKGQRVRRTVVVPDSDAQVPGYVAWLAGMGEGALVVSMADYHAVGPDVLLARQFSFAPASDRCAVVNGSGVVVAVVRADPAMEQHPLGRLLRDPKGVATEGAKALDLGLS